MAQSILPQDLRILDFAAGVSAARTASPRKWWTGGRKSDGLSDGFTWHPDGPSYATTVELTFEPVPQGTIVRVEESGYRDTPSGRNAMIDCACGWGEALTLLKVFIEHGVQYHNPAPHEGER